MVLFEAQVVNIDRGDDLSKIQKESMIIINRKLFKCKSIEKDCFNLENRNKDPFKMDRITKELTES